GSRFPEKTCIPTVLRFEAGDAIFGLCKGVGKSGIGAEMLEQAGVRFFNPDKVAHQFQSTYRRISQEVQNGAAWQQGRRLLERVSVERTEKFSCPMRLHAQPHNSKQRLL